MSNYAVRDGFRKYGARMHFDNEQNPTAIFDYDKNQLVKPGDELWEHAKLLVRCSILALMQVQVHLLGLHILCSNEVTLAKEKFLPPDHPIRRLLNVFTYRSNNINYSSTVVLLPELSFLPRGVAFTYDSYKELMVEGKNNSTIFEPFSNKDFGKPLQDLGDEFPFMSDGLEYFDILMKFVEEWLDHSGDNIKDDDALAFYSHVQKSTMGQKYEIPAYETKEDLCKLIAQFIWNSTALHELVGNTVGDFSQFQDGWCLRIVDNATKADAQGYLIGLILAALTSLRTPKLASAFMNYFAKGDAPPWERTVWNNFQSALKEQGQKVEEKNKSRRFPSKYFNPLQFECAISV